MQPHFLEQTSQSWVNIRFSNISWWQVFYDCLNPPFSGQPVWSQAYKLKEPFMESSAVIVQSLLWLSSWTAAHQAPLSMGFSRRKYWSGLPFPSPGISQPRDWTCISCIRRKILNCWATREAHRKPYLLINWSESDDNSWDGPLAVSSSNVLLVLRSAGTLWRQVWGRPVHFIWKGWSCSQHKSTRPPTAVMPCLSLPWEDFIHHTPHWKIAQSYKGAVQPHHLLTAQRGEGLWQNLRVSVQLRPRPKTPNWSAVIMILY